MQPFCAAVDWGTTHFRLWLLDDQGRALASRHSHEGMTHCQTAGFQPVLDTHLAAVEAPDDLPVIICGMAGARQGWIEAQYLDTPAPVSEIASHAVPIPSHKRDIRLLPGIAQRDPSAPDVMRGEETQLMGIIGSSREAMVICLPGTHSKWVAIADGTVRRFRTFMTGELFSVIGQYTILSHSMGNDDDSVDNGPFLEAVRAGIDNPSRLTANLFGIRAAGLLNFAAQGTGRMTLSGLLIGAEIAGMRDMIGDIRTISVVAASSLAERYRQALAAADYSVACTDGDEAVQRGLFAAARLLWSPTLEPVLK